MASARPTRPDVRCSALDAAASVAGRRAVARVLRASRRMDGAWRPRSWVWLLGFLVAAPVAAQPTNDACVARKVVTAVPYRDVEPVGDATLDAGEHEPGCAVGAFDHSVWYDLVTPVDGLYQVTTCGSDFDTVLQVYDGDICSDLIDNPGLCNDDSSLCGPGTHQSTALFRRLRLKSIHVQVGSAGGTAGTLRFTAALVGLATNDGCDAARAITHPVFTDIADVSRTGGGDAADPTFLSRCGPAGDVDLGPAPHSVWYLYRAAQSGTVTIDTNGTNTAVAVAVFNDGPEGCGRLGARVACTASGGLAFDAVADRSYRLFVAVPTDTTPDRLVFRFVGPNAPPVADAGAAQTVAPGIRVGLDAGASRDPDGDPLTYAWTQTSGAPVALDDPASATPRFTAPAGDGALGFAMTVSDGAATAQATATVTVSAAVADSDGDGVGIPADRCPDTPSGSAVDADGCACGEPGHADCTAGTALCVVGRCEPSTGRCVADPAPQGTACTDDGDACTNDVCDGAGSCGHVPVSCTNICRRAVCDPGTGACSGAPVPAGAHCADDGDACTDDVCDAAGDCTHPDAGSFAGAACRVGALADDVARVAGLSARDTSRLGKLLGQGRTAIAVAEAARAAGNGRVSRQRLARAARTLATFGRRVRRLEARGKLGLSPAARLLDATEDAMARVDALRSPRAAGRLPSPG